MFIDYLTTAALASEMRELLIGARVQDVVQPNRLSVSLELYAGARWYLTLTADPQREGIALTGERARRGADAPTPLLLALRATAIGARLSRVEQPPFERILELTFVGAESVRLVAEPMGRMANVLLLDAHGTIVATARSVTRRMTAARLVRPGHPYAPPPAQHKSKPGDVDGDLLAAWLSASPETSAWRVLVNRVLGVSPLAAREIVCRALGDPRHRASSADATRLVTLLHELLALPEADAWSPTVALGDPEAAYAPYELTHLHGATPVATVREALELFERARLSSDPYRAARSEVQALIDAAREKASRRLKSIKREVLDDEAIERLRWCGDLILAYQTQVAPGSDMLEAQRELDKPPLRIKLDPTLTPLENATAYYDRYRRARKAARDAPARAAKVEAALATLDQLATDLELAEDRSSIDLVRDCLHDTGLGEQLGGRSTGQPSGPLKCISSDGFTVYVGRNSRQNETVTFARGKRGDRWLHVRDAPGGHVVVKAAGREVPLRTLREAAGLAAYFSRLRDSRAVAVAVTDVRHVRRLRGGGPGMVTFRRERTLTVAPLPPDQLCG